MVFACLSLDFFVSTSSRQKIKATFRTETGKKYGPPFIDLGLAVGKKLHDVILSEFSDHL